MSMRQLPRCHRLRIVYPPSELCFPPFAHCTFRNGFGFWWKIGKLRRSARHRTLTVSNKRPPTHCQFPHKHMQKWIGFGNRKNQIIVKSSNASVLLCVSTTKNGLGGSNPNWMLAQTHTHTHAHYCQLYHSLTHTQTHHTDRVSYQKIRGESTLLILRYTVFTVFLWA